MDPNADGGPGDGFRPDGGDTYGDSGLPPGDDRPGDPGVGPGDDRPGDTGPPPPVFSQLYATCGSLDNTLVFANVHRDGTLEVGRVGYAPIVMDRDEEDHDIVCLLVAGVLRCDNMGAMVTAAPEDSGSISQTTVTAGDATCVRTTFLALPADQGGVLVTKAVNLFWDVCVSPGSDEVVVRLYSTGDYYGLDLEKLYFPYAPRLDEMGTGYAVLPIFHGFILPVGWIAASPVWTYTDGGGAVLHAEWDADGMGWSQPFFGIVEGDGRGLYVGMRTEADAGIRVHQRMGGAPRVTPMFKASHNLFWAAPPREIVYVPLVNADYNTIALRYREEAIANGRHVPLTEKLVSRPKLSRMFGGAFVPATSCYYAANESTMHYYSQSFDEIWQRVDAAATELTDPIQRGVVHLDGWGQRGYDNLHPDVVLETTSCVPATDGTVDCGPCDQAGSGWTGFSALTQNMATTDAEHAYLFELHDNYRDFYLDSVSYGAGEDTIRGYDGNPYPATNAWAGGWQRVLCAAQALPYLQRNLNTLANHSALPSAMYLDVFAGAPAEQCYGKDLSCSAPGVCTAEHRMTRTQSLQYRSQLFSELRSRGIVVASEQPADWAFPLLDHVYWSTYLRIYDPAAVDPRYRAADTVWGTHLGVPVPLVELVYHDSVIVPWPIFSGNRDIVLDAWVDGGMPMISIAQLERQPYRHETRRLMALHEEVATQAMVHHDYLDDGYMRQISTFSEGGSVTIDRRDLTVETSGISGVAAGPFTSEPRYQVTVRASSWQSTAPYALEVSLEWRATDALTALPSYRVFLHALDPVTRAIYGNGDHWPSPTTTTWAASSVHSSGPGTMTLSQDGTFDLVAGLYDPAQIPPRLDVLTSYRDQSFLLGRVTVTGGVVTVDTRPNADVKLVEVRQVTSTSVEMMTEWMIDAPLAPGLEVFFHVIDDGGTIIENADYVPVMSIETWPISSRRREARRQVTFQASEIPGSYRVVTGMFAPATSERVDFSTSNSSRQIELGRVVLDGSGGQITRVRFCPQGLTGCPGG